MQKRTRQDGLADAREQARGELSDIRTKMESAIDVAARMGDVARRFADRLSSDHRAAMLTELDDAARQTAKRRTAAEIAAGDRPGGAGPRRNDNEEDPRE